MRPNATYEQLSMLCPGDKFPTQQRILDDAHIPGIGKWFLDHEKTQKWLTGDGKQVLWLHGPSASGKTFLSSSLVNHIHENNSMGVGIFYFGQRDVQNNLADYDLAFRSITRQLVSQTPGSLGLYQGILDNDEIGVQDIDGSSDILETIQSVFGRMVVVLDGVDATNERGLAQLLHLLLEFSRIPSLRVLMTSRSGAPDRLKDYGLSEVEARSPDSDIALYFAKYIDESHVDHEVLHESHTRLLPYQKFIDISNGLFLPLRPNWFSNIASQPNKTFLDLVEAGSPDVPKAFCQALVRDLQLSEESDTILYLLYHVVKCDEMGYFFTARMVHEAIDAWGIRNQDVTQCTTDEIIGPFQRLVFIDSKTQAMVIRSPLLMNHLRNTVFGDEYHKRHATASIQYLSNPDFATGACKSSKELKERFQAHPYLWFAAKCNLPRSLPPSFESDFFIFVASQGNLDSYLQAREAWPYLDDETYDECERDTERWNCYTRGTTALGLAVTLGNEGILRKFIEKGADLEARDGDLNTALHIAAFDEDESDMLKVLLQAGSNVAVVNEEGLTPLAIAIVHGSLDSVKLLIEFGVDVRRLDEEDLRLCVDEKPDIAEYLAGLGVEMPVRDDGDDDEDD
ncbi:uncharacterized protein FIESC28_07269 [Fusarium coffeatum]|uniref:NACHT domain-containing protein n=1 Tax=Fusarium coffeatum TaxID=231269 RepID=A0A366RGD8_9HYPO|nr:uncharacterized protein FIESC28_07269 [Fusarium coffeatum]RBR15628.1 hypothetical protein FIESC28_07269 [Fusarium coffeatum]